MTYKEPKADDYGEGTYVEDPNNIVREDFGEKTDLLDAEKLAADWEERAHGSRQKLFEGVTNLARSK